MTQRDDAARMVSHDPLEPNERQSVTRPISSVRETDEPSQDERTPAEEARLSAVDAGRGERPTLMGLAPIELDEAAAPNAERPKSAEPETSTVMPAHWLADASQDVGPHALAQQDANPSAAAAEREADEEPATAAVERQDALEASMFVPSENTPVAASGDAQHAVLPAAQPSMFVPSENTPVAASGDAQHVVLPAAQPSMFVPSENTPVAASGGAQHAELPAAQPMFVPSENTPVAWSGDAQHAELPAAQPSMFVPSENTPVAASGDAQHVVLPAAQPSMFVPSENTPVAWSGDAQHAALPAAQPSMFVPSENAPVAASGDAQHAVHSNDLAPVVASGGARHTVHPNDLAPVVASGGAQHAVHPNDLAPVVASGDADAAQHDERFDEARAAVAGLGAELATQQSVTVGANAPVPVGSIMEGQPAALVPEHARLPEEGESEWLDLSTRWLVTSAPRTEALMVDDNEVTDAYWAERLSARVAARPDSHSSAPPPPQPTQVPGTRRATVTYGRPSSPASPEPQNLDAPAQRAWARSRRRQSTLAGISPLPEEPNAWPPARESAPVANDARYGRPSNEPNPWREEPSYSDAPRPQAHPPGYGSPTGTVPPWAGNPYTMQPQAAGMPSYAASSWNGSAVTLPPPWTAPPTYGVAVQHLPPTAAYAPNDRRAMRTVDYALPPVSGNGTGSMRPVRPPQSQPQPTSEISIEQWKGMANTWFMTVGKLALAAMALHFSGLAKPLLANFGYAPASASTHEPAPAASPAAASLAAPSVIPEGLSPEAADEAAARRGSTKREPGESSARRHSKPYKARPKQPKAARAAAAEPAAASAVAATREVAASPAAGAPAAPAATAAPRTAAVAPAAPVAMAAPQAAVAPAAAALAAPQAESTPESQTAAISESEEAVGEALLRINSRPWSEIFVDGIHVGHTPKLDLRVSAGSHRIRLVNQDLELTKTFEVNVAAGETLSHVELFID